MRIKPKAAILVMATMTAVFAQENPIDTARSSISIHTGKAGLLSAASHEHWIDAPISAGTIDDSAHRVTFTVQAAKMAVKPDPKIDGKTQATIQKDMQEMTLEPQKYPEISFHSTRAEKTGDGWKVDGELSLHGVTRPITVLVKHSGDAYTGHATLKQTDYGIKPISIAGGAIKVKNEIEIDFQIYTR